jgi:uncharacterized tellurite resistance protein B-like protein
VTLADELDEFFSDEKEVLVVDPLRFKARLGIGEKAYGSLRTREHLRTFVEALAVGGVASGAASSSVVAGAFFANTGFVATALSSIGLGAAAVTPIGWVIASGVVCGGAYATASKLLERNKETGLVVVPKYINTPLDVLAAGLVDLMLPVSVKIANADGAMCDKERESIRNYFVDEWGYNEGFVARKIAHYEREIDKISYEPIARSFKKYCDESKDCDRQAIVSDFLTHLEDVVYADGQFDHQETLELELLRNLLNGNIGFSDDPDWYRHAKSAIEKGAGLSAATGRRMVDESRRALEEVRRVTPGIMESAKSHATKGAELGRVYGAKAGEEIASKAKWFCEKVISDIKKLKDNAP